MKNLLRVCCGLLWLATQLAAADPTPVAQDDAAGRDLQAIRDFLKASGQQVNQMQSPLEMERRLETLFSQLRDMSTAYIANHPNDPRRWIVVDLLFPSGPRFVKDWGPLDDEGRPTTPVVDEAAAAEWKAKILAWKADMAKATDVPEEVHSRKAEREAQLARMEARGREFAEKFRDGRVAPDFPMTDIDGKPVRLADFAGKVVVLDFWATWCGPCKAAMPHTQDVAAKYKDQGVVVVASCTNDTRDKFEKWVRTNSAKYPNIIWAFDPLEKSTERASQKLYQVLGIPTQVVIDRNGRMVDAILGNHPGKSLLEEGLARAGIKVDPAALAKAGVKVDPELVARGNAQQKERDAFITTAAGRQ